MAIPSIEERVTTLEEKIACMKFDEKKVEDRLPWWCAGSP
jgi:hypothetical protein